MRPRPRSGRDALLADQRLRGLEVEHGERRVAERVQRAELDRPGDRHRSPFGRARRPRSCRQRKSLSSAVDLSIATSPWPAAQSPSARLSGVNLDRLRVDPKREGPPCSRLPIGSPSESIRSVEFEVDRQVEDLAAGRRHPDFFDDLRSGLSGQSGCRSSSPRRSACRRRRRRCRRRSSRRAAEGLVERVGEHVGPLTIATPRRSRSALIDRPQLAVEQALQGGAKHQSLERGEGLEDLVALSCAPELAADHPVGQEEDPIGDRRRLRVVRRPSPSSGGSRRPSCAAARGSRRWSVESRLPVGSSAKTTAGR